MRKTLLLCALPLLAACARERSIVAIPPAACAGLIPTEWAQGVPPEPIPDEQDLSAWLGKPYSDAMGAAIIRPWASAYVGQAGQLAKANGRTADAIGIMTRCEEMVNAARPR